MLLLGFLVLWLFLLHRLFALFDFCLLSFSSELSFRSPVTTFWRWMSRFCSRLRTIFLFSYSVLLPFSPHCPFYLTTFFWWLSRDHSGISLVVFLRRPFLPFPAISFLFILLLLLLPPTMLLLACRPLGSRHLSFSFVCTWWGKSGYVHDLQPFFEPVRSMKGFQALSYIMSCQHRTLWAYQGVFILLFVLFRFLFMPFVSRWQIRWSRPPLLNLYFDWSSTVLI